ncbi:MAG: hypothetical protein AAFV53_30685 [Myxococcota bacterium]
MADQNTPPPWTSALNAEQYATFITTLQTLFSDQGLDATIDVGRGVLAFTDPQSDSEGEFDLAGLADAAGAAPDAAAMRALLTERLDEVFMNFGDNTEALALNDDWEKARGRILPRLHPLELVEDNAETVTYRDVGGGLAAVLVYDLPSSLYSIEPDVTATWPVNAEELWATALDNLRNEAPSPDVEEVMLDEVQVVVVYGDSFVITSRMLILEDVLDPEEFPYGALVAAPHRHLMAFVPILNADQATAAIEQLILLAREEHADGPGPLSADLFWWLSGDIERIVVEVDEANRELLIDPPETLVDLLDALAEADEDDDLSYFDEE